MPRPSARTTYLPPLPSLPTLCLMDPGPLLHTPYLIGATVLLSPTDPLLPEIAAAQAGDADISASIRIPIPPTVIALILNILRQYHDSSLAGHYGVARTHAVVGQYYKWAGLATAVEGYVRSCDACQRNKVVRHAPFGLVKPAAYSL